MLTTTVNTFKTYCFTSLITYTVWRFCDYVECLLIEIMLPINRIKAKCKSSQDLLIHLLVSLFLRYNTATFPAMQINLKKTRNPAENQIATVALVSFSVDTHHQWNHQLHGKPRVARNQKFTFYVFLSAFNVLRIRKIAHVDVKRKITAT